jgi:pseudouridine synthase
MKKLRLHQFLRMTGLFKTNNDIKEAVTEGEVRIDGEIITNPEYQFRPSTHKATWKDKPLSAVLAKSYLLFNKPTGYISTKLTDLDIKLHKKSIFSFIEKTNVVEDAIKKSLFAVGRLDEDTSGLLIITNDGKLGSKIAVPRSNIEKTYAVVLENNISQPAVERIQEGILITLEHNGTYTTYRTKPCKIKNGADQKHLYITVTEGKKREIRRIFESVGHNVVMLERIAIGKILLKELNLRQGEFKAVDKNYILERLGQIER